MPGPRRALRKGRAVAARRPHAMSATRSVPCQPVPPRRAPDTTALRLSAGSGVGVKVSKINRQQRIEAFSSPTPNGAGCQRSEIWLDNLMILWYMQDGYICPVSRMRRGWSLSVIEGRQKVTLIWCFAGITPEVIERVRTGEKIEGWLALSHAPGGLNAA